jgi:hypothetical protein
MKQEVSIIMYSRNRRYDSGFEKCKKKQRLEAAAQSQKSALDRFVLKESQINSENQTPEGNNIDEIESHGDYANTSVEGEARVVEIDQGDDANIGEEVSGEGAFLNLSW